MITGAIAVLLLVVVLPASASNGEWGTFWITIGIAAVVLWFGVLSREQDRAYLNWEHFWATGELPKKPQAPHRERVKPWWRVRYELWRAKRRRERYVREGLERFRTEGKQEVVFCPTCGKRPKTTVRLTTVNGEEMWQCRCPECGAVLTRKY